MPATFRTDEHNNPTAFTTALAAQAGLHLGTDYEQGASFWTLRGRLFTARLLGDPVELTLRVLDRVGFYTAGGALRWSYVGIFLGVWVSMTRFQKIATISGMYAREGGVKMKLLIVNAMTAAARAA